MTQATVVRKGRQFQVPLHESRQLESATGDSLWLDSMTLIVADF